MYFVIYNIVYYVVLCQIVVRMLNDTDAPPRWRTFLTGTARTGVPLAQRRAPGPGSQGMQNVDPVALPCLPDGHSVPCVLCVVACRRRCWWLWPWLRLARQGIWCTSCSLTVTVTVTGYLFTLPGCTCPRGRARSAHGAVGGMAVEPCRTRGACRTHRAGIHAPDDPFHDLSLHVVGQNLGELDGKVSCSPCSHVAGREDCVFCVGILLCLAVQEEPRS